jgi:GT2 family glycosyltransferase
MRASIVVVSYNSRAYLGACLASLQNAARRDDELIVVDNGSTDGSGDLVAQLFPNVRLIRAENTGYAGGNNRGAAVTEGDYLVFINPDTVVHPGAIDALVAPLAKGGEVALTTACITLLSQPETINACGNTVHYTGLAYCRGAGKPVAEYAASAEVDAVSGAAFAIRRSVFEELGGFDEQFFMYVEDTDLSLRARLSGYRCWYAAGARVQHDYHPSYTPQKAFYLDRNRHLMLLKNLSRETYMRLLPGLLLGEVVTWGFLIVRGYWGVKPRVYAALWRNRRSLNDVQRGRSRRAEALVSRLTHRLEFGQLAGRAASAAAGALFHPAFWLAQRAVGGGEA